MKGKKKRIWKSFMAFCLALCMLFGVLPGGLQIVKPVRTEAACSAGIMNNGLGGISININGAPFTTFENYDYGEYAYGGDGCAWFASARVNQLTGQGNIIRAGTNWWKNNPYGWEKSKADVVGACYCMLGRTCCNCRED